MLTRIIKAACGKAAAIAMAAVAVSTTLTLHADDPAIRNWIGKEQGVANTAESPYTIQNLANWDGEGNIGYGCQNHLYLSVPERTYINSTKGETDRDRFGNDFCPNSGEFVFTGPLWNLCLKEGNVADSTVSIVKKSGDWTFQTYGMYIGRASGTTATFVNESGNITSTGNNGVHIGCVAGATGIVENISGDWTIAGSLTVGDASGGTGAFTIKGGSVSSGGALNIANNGATGALTVAGGSLSVDGSLYVIRDDTNNSGTLTIKGGTVTVSPTGYTIFSKGYGSINLDGGTLVTKQINRWGSNGTRVQHINFNGGTLKANAAGNLIYAQYGYLYVTVNAGGGTIDCNGNAITIDQGPRYNDFKGVGGLTFTGGNTITISNNVTYSGATYVAAGTTLKLAKTSASSILSNGMALIGAPAVGTAYTLLTSITEEDDWSDLDLTNVKCPFAASITPALGADGKSITVTVNALKSGYWTGAAGDNNLSTEGNWSDGNVPSGNAVIFSSVPVTLTKGETFAPASITFDAGSSAVTIDGNFTTLTSVTNNSSVNQTFAGFVDFGAGNIDVTATATLNDKTVTGGCVVFKGGVTGAKVANHSIVAGNYTLTTDDPFTATNELERFTVYDGSLLSVKTIGGWNTNDTQNLNIGEGATFCVADVTRTVSGVTVANRLWYWNKGTYIVTNFTFTGVQSFWLGGFWNELAANADAVLKIGTLTINSGGALALHGTGGGYGTTLMMYIGEGGLNIKPDKAGYYKVTGKAHKTTMRPWNSDFTFGRGSNANYDFLLGADADESRIQNINFTLNTDDEAGVPRTVTMAARICTSNNTSSITVAGHGTNIVTSASPLMTGTYKLTDAATVVLSNGVAFANGTISLGDGTTLEYSNSGNTLTLPCASLVLPSSGKATLRINGVRLKDGEHTLVSGVSAGAASLLDVEPAASVLDGRRYEVAEKNGYLVLNIISSGMIIIFN